MKLEIMTEEDVELRVRLQTDPQMMAELGGPRPREAIERAHAKSLALAAEGRCWPLKIIPDGGSSPAGGVDVFESSHEDKAIYEIGWMILPEFQNRGIASQAVREVLERARGSGCLGRSTPFPRSRTALPARSVRRTASRTWESARSSSPDGVFAATTGGSICSESGGGGEGQELFRGLGALPQGSLFAVGPSPVSGARL
jgi:GNAT superfamily N-acetyltransferase